MESLRVGCEHVQLVFEKVFSVIMFGIVCDSG